MGLKPAREIIRTERLVLRPLREEDAQPIFERLSSDPEVMAYLPTRPATTPEDAEAMVKRSKDAWESGDAYIWAITRANDGELIGNIVLRSEGFKCETGYSLAKSEWGKGYMSEAVKAVADMALNEMGVYRVWAVCDLENIGSARVLEKAGMEKEGILKRFVIHINRSEEPRDVVCYAKTR